MAAPGDPHANHCLGDNGESDSVRSEPCAGRSPVDAGMSATTVNPAGTSGEGKHLRPCLETLASPSLSPYPFVKFLCICKDIAAFSTRRSMDRQPTLSLPPFRCAYVAVEILCDCRPRCENAGTRSDHRFWELGIMSCVTPPLVLNLQAEKSELREGRQYTSRLFPPRKLFDLPARPQMPSVVPSCHLIAGRKTTKRHLSLRLPIAGNSDPSSHKMSLSSTGSWSCFPTSTRTGAQQKSKQSSLRVVIGSESQLCAQ
jgi:hypothetical protein